MCVPILGVIVSMWRKAAAVALLALAVGYLYRSRPDLPDQMIQYFLPLLHPSPHSEPSSHTVEQVISSAWEVMITTPAKQWGRVAVG